MSYSTYPIKLQLFQLIFPIVISALKGLANLKKREREKKKEREKKRKRTKGPKRKERQPSPYSQIREVCYPQGAIVELDIHHHSSPFTINIIYFIHCTHMHI